MGNRYLKRLATLLLSLFTQLSQPKSEYKPLKIKKLRAQ